MSKLLLHCVSPRFFTKKAIVFRFLNNRNAKNRHVPDARYKLEKTRCSARVRIETTCRVLHTEVAEKSFGTVGEWGYHSGNTFPLKVNAGTANMAAKRRIQNSSLYTLLYCNGRTTHCCLPSTMAVDHDGYCTGTTFRFVCWPIYLPTSISHRRLSWVFS